MPDDFRMDVYQGHSAPDSPQYEANRLDSAADVLIASAVLVEETDEV
ncbi:hypothetical protein [Streptomyces olivochromogenes]|nr:hypothetical protein [Streptomyces olivochromogenes]MCF3132456.1 hypothetical protein [Streptomyces olivochromogenes]